MCHIILNHDIITNIITILLNQILCKTYDRNHKNTFNFEEQLNIFLNYIMQNEY